jgi:hypothetical protein
MSDADALQQARALRNDAWALVHEDLAQLRDGLASKPIAERIKERAVDQLVDVVDTARDVAEDNKAVIAVTIAALMGWMFRRPLTTLATDWLPAHNPFKGD